MSGVHELVELMETLVCLAHAPSVYDVDVVLLLLLHRESVYSTIRYDDDVAVLYWYAPAPI